MGSNVSIGANVQFNNDANPPNITINPRNDLSRDTVYAISYPSGAFTQSGAGGSFVGTGYTFYTSSLKDHSLWSWGRNNQGQLGQNGPTSPANIGYSSPVQIGSNTNWIDLPLSSANSDYMGAINKNGELWMWGTGTRGELGQNDIIRRSSPVQVPGTTWGESTTSLGNKTHLSLGMNSTSCIKTDGTLWSWGYNSNGTLGHNNTVKYSSPVQVPGTTWKTVCMGWGSSFGIKTDGTMWSWGRGDSGDLGQNSRAALSSPTQIPGTTWSQVESGNDYGAFAIKTDGTLWAWGGNNKGQLGQNSRTYYSSPVQIPGTTWSQVEPSSDKGPIARKTDGTLWAWGRNEYGQLGQNNKTDYSSPTQVPGTTWANLASFGYGALVTKTDGTLWSWGYNGYGCLGQNDTTQYSSPVQIPGTDWPKTDRKKLEGASMGVRVIKTDGTFWVWGRGARGQLGQNNVTDYSSPVQIPGTNYITVGCSGDDNGSFALREQG